ncbi:HsdR family type I site-specific deoxyribonuclease [uncultured Cohaesibacter sp.]|uniref:type I restriction endonuclease subunit R n=1 Tax=uncultured Cohaesibacter sp. TaxID=1002546 RepID=UPI002AAC1882|nr:HsdR family type I site-specific deoxyribonuclease [uncultured Cohaesibacter sp.]
MLDQLTPITTEEAASKIPALALMINMGWAYVSADECLARRGSNRAVLLEDSLRVWLDAYRFDYRGRLYPLSDDGKAQVMKGVTNLGLAQGLAKANEALHTILTLGITVSEFMPDGHKQSVTVSLVNWKDIGANRFEVTEEMSVERQGQTTTYRPDIVGFVNGLPLLIIEAKKAVTANKDKMVEEAISQHIRNQMPNGIQSLYAYGQVLMALAESQARYGTTETPKKFWAAWHEEEISEVDMLAIKNSPLAEAQKSALLAGLPAKVKAHLTALWSADMAITEQDRLLIGIAKPDRLLEFVRYFLLFDSKVGKIAARYQQFFGVRAMLAQVQQRDEKSASGRKRKGGIIWHTTGSGKSYTMVFLCRALLHNPDLAKCRLLIVLDRTDLEKQLAATFRSGGAFGSAIATKKEGEKARAESGQDLAKRIGAGTDRIIFTLLQKFNSATKYPECKNDSEDMIVLVDEGHRSQGGENHERMQLALPNAAFIAFTGTPLLKERKTENKFGKILHAYTMREAVDDGTVTPLLYEERQPQLDINDKAIDNWFEKITTGLTDEQKADLKRKFSSKGQVYGAEQRIRLIAFDIATHFCDSFKDIGLKGQLATDSKLSAIRYKKVLDETGLVTSAVIISPPDTREGHEDTNAANAPEVQTWWADNVGNDADAYEESVISGFSLVGPPDILIVVDKLLTGFDEPRNAVLYIEKDLKQHNLLQAIARVNRLHEDKKFGYLVDYRGILKELDTSLQDYQKLADETRDGYDPEDLEGIYANVSTEYLQLPKLHRELWALFAGVQNKADKEQFRRLLVPKMEAEEGMSFDANLKFREDFYVALTNFGMCLKLATSTRAFFEDPGFDEVKLNRYKADLKFFMAIRQQARADAMETVDFSQYEKQIRNLLDHQVTGVAIKDPDGLIQVGGNTGDRSEDPEDWSDEKKKNEADLIRTRVTQTIEVDLADDPYAQAVFSELLREAIAEAEAMFDFPGKQYDLFKDLEEQVKGGAPADIPEAIKGNRHVRAYYGIFKQQVDPVCFEELGEEHFIAEAQLVDGVVMNAIAANSLSQEDIMNDISRSLLPPFFKTYGDITVAQKLIAVIQDKVRAGATNGSF